MSDCDAAVVGKEYFPARMAGKLTLRLVQEACKVEKLQTAPKKATIKTALSYFRRQLVLSKKVTISKECNLSREDVQFL